MPPRRRFRRSRPRRTRRRFTVKRRRFVVRRKRFKSRISRTRAGFITRDSLVAKMPYPILGNFSLTQPTIQNQRWRGNGPSDPDGTGAGAQPLNYDVYQINYRNQITYGSKLKLLFQSLKTDGNMICVILPAPATESTAIDGMSTLIMMQQKYAKSWILGNRDGGHNQVVLKSYMSTAKMFGKIINTEAEFASTTDALPSLEWYWFVRVDGTGTGTTNNTFTIKGAITYYTKFFGRETVLLS